MADALGWLIPSAIVFGVAALLVALGVWALRRSARGPRARDSADRLRARAGQRLVALDDQVDELDLEVGLSGAMYGGEAPASLRRARLTAQHSREALFAEYRDLMASVAPPHDQAHAADRITARADQVLGIIAAARAEHNDWMRANVSAAQQVEAARRRLDALHSGMGEPSALVAELAERFAPEEWADAARAAESATAGAAEAQRLLDTAATQAADPSLAALPTLAAAERALRGAQDAARTLEETHRVVTQAATAVPGELDAARAAIRQAMAVRDGLEPGDAERLAAAIRDADTAVEAASALAELHPTAAVHRIARLRDRLDMALGDARTAQQRLRGARTALPGTLAAARAAVGHVEASLVRAHAGADARVRLESAQQELAAARRAQDPVEALDAARRAMRHAEDAQALADYARLSRG